jgi:hypothetical protein
MKKTVYILFSLFTILSIIYIIICFNSKNKENYGEIQFFITEPNAMNSNSLKPTIERCMNLCSQLNSEQEDIAQCVTTCSYNSGYAPSPNYFYPDMNTLVNMM